MESIVRVIVLLLLFVLVQISHLVASVWALCCIAVGSDRAWRIIVAEDRKLNAATGGSDRETISSRAWRGSVEGRRGWCLLCRLLDIVQKDHCKRSAGT